MAESVRVIDQNVAPGGGETAAPVSAVAPVGTEPGLYVRIVSPGGVPAGPVTIADGADVAEGTTTDPAWVAGAGTVISLLKKIASAGGSAVSIADGADVAQGTTTDADTVNTVIGRLKKIVALLTATLTVTGPLTDAQLRATPVPVSGTVTANAGAGTMAVSGPLTDAQLRASAVPVSAAALPLPAGAATEATLLTRTKPADQQHVIVDSAASIAVTGPLTDAQLRATPVPVSGTVSVGTVPVTGPLTDAQLRASAVPVSGPLTDGQLRATPVPVSGTVTANPATYGGKTITYVPVNQGAAGTTVLAAAVGGSKHKVLGAILTLSATGTLKLTDGVGDLTGPLDVTATGGFVVNPTLMPFTETAAVNRALNLVTTTGAARGVVIVLTEA